MLTTLIDATDAPALPLHAVTPARFDAWLATLPPEAQTWITAQSFRGEAGRLLSWPDAHGRLAGAAVGLGDDPLAFAQAAESLPAALYRLDPTGLPPGWATEAALAWALAGYRFTRYRPAPGPTRSGPRLVWPSDADRALVEALASAITLAQDLINTPAEDLGPAELAQAAHTLAMPHAATLRVIDGETLRQGYPLIHAVGRASTRPPCLIDLTWGQEDHPSVTLVGKGVCFDSGGLDLKTSSGMRLMKKDMGGAAHVLALAALVMTLRLPLRLRVLIPAVDNMVSGNALRPGDVLVSRKGLSVEIGNTDAEGRLILADALTEACASAPDLVLDCATLTGAARVALGPDLPALFSPNDTLAQALLDASTHHRDPLWRLPLWAPYRSFIDSPIASLTNSGDSPFAGAITAALFLQAFVDESVPWAHVDLYAWRASGRPGRPEGGAAQGLRAFLAVLQRLGNGNLALREKPAVRE